METIGDASNDDTVLFCSLDFKSSSGLIVVGVMSPELGGVSKSGRKAKFGFLRMGVGVLDGKRWESENGSEGDGERIAAAVNGTGDEVAVGVREGFGVEGESTVGEGVGVLLRATVTGRLVGGTNFGPKFDGIGFAG